MAVSSAQITMGATRTLITRADTDGCVVYVHNRTGTVVYVGGADVTAANGMGIDSAAGPVRMTLDATDTLYGITASGTPDIQVLRIGNAV